MPVNRRTVLGFALGTTLAGSVPIPAARAAETFALWKDEPPGGGGPTGPVRIDRKGAVSNVAEPFVEAFRPAKPNGSAVLVASGGGYTHIENGMEAHPAAAWLAERGVTAFVLTYRLPREGWTAGAGAPLQDAQRATRLLRSGAFGPVKRLATLGFSAGGHLMGLACAWADRDAYAPVDGVDAGSVRPDATALVYPVITLEPPFDHTSTRRELVGDRPSPAAGAEWSVQTHVRPGMPPTFLAQAEDDPVSDPHNTLIMAAACRAAGARVDMHRYAFGGHGFGMGRPGTPTVQWPAAYADWLSGQGMLG